MPRGGRRGAGLGTILAVALAGGLVAELAVCVLTWWVATVALIVVYAAISSLLAPVVFGPSFQRFRALAAPACS